MGDQEDFLANIDIGTAQAVSNISDLLSLVSQLNIELQKTSLLTQNGIKVDTGAMQGGASEKPPYTAAVRVSDPGTGQRRTSTSLTQSTSIDDIPTSVTYSRSTTTGVDRNRQLSDLVAIKIALRDLNGAIDLVTSAQQRENLSVNESLRLQREKITLQTSAVRRNATVDREQFKTEVAQAGTPSEKLSLVTDRINAERMTREQEMRDRADAESSGQVYTPPIRQRVDDVELEQLQRQQTGLMSQISAEYRKHADAATDIATREGRRADALVRVRSEMAAINSSRNDKGELSSNAQTRLDQLGRREATLQTGLTSESERESAQIAVAAERQRQVAIRESESELRQLSLAYDRLSGTTLKRDLAGLNPADRLARIRQEQTRPDLTEQQSLSLQTMERTAARQVQAQSEREAEQISANAERRRQAAIRESSAEVRRLAAEYDKLANATLQRDLAGQPKASQLARVGTELARPDLTDPQRLKLEAVQQRLIPQTTTEAHNTAMAVAAAKAATGDYAGAIALLNAEAGRAGLSQQQLTSTIKAQTQAVNEGARAFENEARQSMAGMNRPQRISELSGRQTMLDRVIRTGVPERTPSGLEVTPETASKAREWTNVQIKELNRLQTASSSTYDNIFSIFTRQLERIGIGIAIWQILRGTLEAIDAVIKANAELSLSSTRFALVTEQSIDRATNAYLKLQRITTEAGIKPTEAGPAIINAARFTQDSRGQEQLIDTSSKLARVLGMDVAKAEDIVIAALRQQGLSAADAARQGDYLISIWGRLPGTVEQVSSSLQEAAPLSDKLGISFEKTLSIIALGASTTGETAESVTNALVRVTNSLQGLEGDKFVDVTEGFRKFGIEATSAPGKLKPVLDIIQDVAKIFPTLSGTQQLDIMKLLFGGEKIRPEYEAVTRGIMAAFASGFDNGIPIITGALDKASNAIDESLGQLVKRIDARKEEVAQSAGVLANLFMSLTDFVFKASGKQGLEKQEGLQIFVSGSGMRAGEEQRVNFLKSLFPLTPDEVKAKVEEWNTQVKKVFDEERAQNPLNPLVWQATYQAKTAVEVSDDQLKAFLKEQADLKAAGVDLSAKPAAAPAGPKVPKVEPAPLTPDPRLTPEDYVRERLVAPESTFTLPTEATDLTKYSMQEVNGLLQTARDEYDQLIQKQIEYMTLLKMAPADIQAAIDKIKEEADRTVTLIRTREGLDYISGPEAKMLPRAVEKKDNVDFNFRRLSDVEPSQAPQLQALITMYTQMLAKMGSPEKSVTINTLLGENNSFKQFNGSMTALQLALEDLTKVEKAQLSGTWNMPAGATALVPISSLDIQRWNKTAGGGMDMEALKALLGATQGSGDKVAGAMGTAADRITAAIREQYDKAGVPHTEENVANASLMAQAAIKTALGGIFGIPQMAAISSGTTMPSQPDRVAPAAVAGGLPTATADPVAAANVTARAIQTAFGALYQGFNKTMFGAPETGVLGGNADQSKAVYSSLSMVANNLARMTAGLGGGLLGGGGTPDTPVRKTFESSEKSRITTPTVNVQVSMLPIKATFNANIMVMLNGAVVARALMPIMYQLLARALVGQGVGSKGAIR